MSKNNSEWILEPLINLGTLVKGKLTLQSENEIPNWLPLINTDSLKNTSRIWANTDGAVTCNKNDVLILWDGERSGLAATNKEGIVGSTFGRFRSTSKIDGKYLYYFIDSKFEWIQNRRTGTGVPHAPKDLSKILFIYYHKNINVQKKIAEILTTCDTVIEQTRAAIEKYKAIKQGMLHDLFTRGLDANGQLRPTPQQAPERYKYSELGLIPKEWEVKRLEDISTMKSGDGITSENISAAGDYPVFGGNGLRGYTSKYTHDGDYVLIGRQGALCGNITRVSNKFFASEHAVVVTHNQDVDVDWLAQKLESMNLNQYSEASAQPGLAVTKILRLFIVKPQYTEQKEIGKRLIPIDTKLQSEEALLAKYQSIKKGLMKDLLSGEREV
jgi:type I restriction enzyme S subunit